ncbi:hypothetical protein [Microbulbifer thermotolerans]|uniref:hypothetical protein n=1 Tax=Microbulbifer thermotolerans TaxID=252514 RepID=UPI000AC56497|nr:hypothetical protein [Microbulbifer thermotolerans]MCX2830652.1 hypothetical protein [Microbulbifer thermotolerans]
MKPNKLSITWAAICLPLLSTLASCEKKSMPDHIDLDGNTVENLKPYIALSTTNYLCGYYGENSGNINAPIDYIGHYELARIMAKSIFLKKNKTMKITAEKFETEILTSINEKFLKEGPDSLSNEIATVLSQPSRTHLPTWIKSCTDVYNYTNAIISQAIAKKNKAQN